MSETKSDFFQCPAYKLLISDIRCAVQKEPVIIRNFEDGGEEMEPEWHLRINVLATKTGQLNIATASPFGKPLDLNLKLVWIQGTVKRIEETGGGNLSLVISDQEDKNMEDLEAVIYEYDCVPGGDHPDIKIGAYVGTLGQIWSNNPVTVKAAKVMCLSDKPIYKTMWRDEVALAKTFLAGLLEPSITL